MELGAIGKVVRGRQAVLLGVLALAAPRSVPTPALLSSVFEGRPEATGGELRVLVSRLRRLLRE
ncbi:MAG: hypothetical protein AB7W59_30380, partial [Acidimicrobiia bacterium]